MRLRGAPDLEFSGAGRDSFAVDNTDPGVPRHGRDIDSNDRRILQGRHADAPRDPGSASGDFDDLLKTGVADNMAAGREFIGSA